LTNITAKLFIDTIFPDLEEDEQVLFSKQPKLNGGFINMNVEAGVKAIAEGSAIYFNVSTVKIPGRGEALRRRKTDCIASFCFVADDIGTKVDKEMVPASYILESSEGSFQYGYRLHPVDDLMRFEAFVSAMGLAGYTDPGAEGCNRLMRVPGSINIKPNKDNFVSTITEWEPDRVWELDDLAQEFGIDLDNLPVKQLRSQSSGSEIVTLEGVDPMLDWLKETNHIVSDNGDWIDISCPWSSQHTSGGDTAGYSALGRGEGDWVQNRSFNCMHEHCANKTLKDLVKWAIREGGPYVTGYDPLPWLQARYAYVGMTQQVVDLEQRKRGGEWFWDLAAWSKVHPGKITMPGTTNEVSVASAFIASRDTRKAESTIYKPVKAEEDVAMAESNGQLMINIYVPPTHKETDRQPEVFLEHMDYLIPSEEEREIFLNWLAYKMQHPDLRSYAVCMVADGAFGIGRSWIKDMLRAVLQGKVNTASLAQLVGQGTSSENNFNDWLINCQYVVVEEAKDSIDREVFFSAYEKFKQRIDTRVGSDRINIKYGQAKEQPVFFNCLIFSNHRDALALPEGDRRVCVITNSVERNTFDYYERLAAALYDEPAAVYWWLMRRDVTAFDPIYPPMTPGKRAMVEQSMSPSDEIWTWIQENVEAEIVTKDTLRDYVMSAALSLNYDNIMMKPGGVVRMLWGRCGNLRGEDKGARYSILGSQVEIRCLSNEEYWRGIDDVRDKAVFEKALRPSPLRIIA
jgi:hypothetical protein